MSTEDFSRDLARELLAIGAVSLSPASPFTWASGLQSPVYCDNRLTFGFPHIRDLICDGFQRVIRDHDLACDVVAGTATAGIPHAAWLADRMTLPLVYVRGESKTHGMGRQVEGVLEAGSSLIVIEDLVSTGMSSTAVIRPLERAGGRVVAVLAIFSYGLKLATDAFEAAGVPLFTLTSYSALIDVARAEGAIDENDLNSLKDWYQDPALWSERVSSKF